MNIGSIFAGIGRGVETAATMYGNYAIQSKLQSERATAEDLRLSRMEANQAKMFEATQKREDVRQEKGFTQQQAMYEKESERMAGHEQRAIKAASDTAQMQIDKMVELHKIDADQAKQFHTEDMAKAVATLAATKEGVSTLVPQADRTVMVVMKDGSSHLLKDNKGNPVLGLKSVPEAGQIMAKIYATMIESNAADLTRNGLTMTKDEKDANRASTERLKALAAASLGATTGDLAPNPLVPTLTPAGQRNRQTYESDKEKFLGIGGYNQNKPYTPLIPR